MKRYQELLNEAKSLLLAASRKPREIDLRNAIRYGYYAMFHYILEEGGVVVFGTDHNLLSLRRMIARNQSHRNMLEVCMEFSNDKAFASKKIRTIYGHNFPHKFISNFSRLFINMQEKRHEADYGYQNKQFLKKNEVLIYITQVENAINEFRNQLGGGNKGYCKIFIYLMLTYQNEIGSKGNFRDP